jgi:hypothetical protein
VGFLFLKMNCQAHDILNDPFLHCLKSSCLCCCVDHSSLHDVSLRGSLMFVCGAAFSLLQLWQMALNRACQAQCI